MKNKVGKPRNFTDAEAEAYTRYLTQTDEKKKKTIEEALRDWVKLHISKIKRIREGK